MERKSIYIPYKPVPEDEEKAKKIMFRIAEYKLLHGKRRFFDALYELIVEKAEGNK